MKIPVDGNGRTLVTIHHTTAPRPGADQPVEVQHCPLLEVGGLHYPSQRWPSSPPPPPPPPNCSVIVLQKVGKRSDKNFVIGQGQGWPVDPGRTDICQFPLCRHKPYPNPQGILANAKIQRIEGAIARTRGSMRRMNESPHPHRPAHITTLIYCEHVQQPPMFSDMDHFPFSQQCSCPSAT